MSTGPHVDWTACRLDHESKDAAITLSKDAAITLSKGAAITFGRWLAAITLSKDAALTFGPWLAAITFGRWLATADEVADRVEDGRLPLRTEVRLNGERVGGDVTSPWPGRSPRPFAEPVTHASRGTVVRPGDVLGSGTCGTGCPAEIKRTQPGAAPGWLGVGDGVRIEVEEPGVIENRLVPGADPLPVPRGRRRIGVEVIGVEVSAWN